LQSSGNSVSDAPNQYGFFFGAEEGSSEWQRQKSLSGKEGEESFSYPDLLFENMQLMYAACPFYCNGWRVSRSFRRAKAASFTIDQCGRETDAKGLIVKNIAGRFEQLPSMECGKARDVDPL